MPGSLGPGGPRVPPPLPLQPGLGPLPKLPFWLLGLALLSVALESLYRILNRKEKEPEAEWQEGVYYDLEDTDLPIEVTWRQRRGRLPWSSCVDGTFSGIAFDADVIEGTTGGVGVGFTATGFFGSDVFPQGPGTSVAFQFKMDLRRQDGGEVPVFFANSGGNYPGMGLFGLCGSRGKSGSIVSVRVNGLLRRPPAGERPEAPPAAIPFLGFIGGAPEAQPAPPPVPDLLVTIMQEAAPFAEPAALPEAPPAFTPLRVAPPAAPALAPRRAPRPGRVIEVRPSGPIIPSTPAPIIETPVDVVVVGEEIIGGPSQAPPATLKGIAAELGRLERKSESLMTRPPAGADPGPIQDFLETFLEDVLRRLIRDLFSNIPGGEYVLMPPCPPPGGGPAAEPVVVPFEAASDPIGSVSNRIDALAELIQAHKTMRQPICKSPVTGAEVTVHFESDG